MREYFLWDDDEYVIETEDDEVGSELAIKADDLEAVAPIIRLNLADLDEIGTFKIKDSAYPDYRIVQCEPRGLRTQTCPYCGTTKQFHIRGYRKKDKLVHDVNIGLMQIDIAIRVPRYECDTCIGDKTFSHQFKTLSSEHFMTNRLCEQIKKESFTMPFSDIAALHRTSNTTVAKIFDEYATELEETAGPIIAPRVLGIDEKHIVHAMRGVLVDVEAGRLLEMTPNNKRPTLTSVIESMVDYDKRIKIVTMDMYAPYRSMVQEILPFAKVVADKYHVIQALQQRVKPVKTRISDMLARNVEFIEDPEERKRLKTLLSTANKDHYLFKYSKNKLEAKEPKRLMLMAELCQEFPDFNHLRLLKEMFEGIYDARTRQEAEQQFAEWVKLVPPDNKGKAGQERLNAWQREYRVMPEIYAEFRALRNTMENWHKEIFNYFDDGCRYTNAATEGLNNLIERINRIGNGYGFARLRAKALYWHKVTTGRKYVFKSERLPIYEKPKFDFHNVGYSDFGKLGSGTMGRDKVIGVKEELRIVEEEAEQTPRQPWTLFSYIPEDSPWKIPGSMEYSGEA